MAITNQELTDRYALYNGDCVEAIKQLPEKSVHLSVYSPPFCGLYNYSSDDRDMSNCKSYGEFFEHFEFLVRELMRVTVPGRMTAVHCMDVPGKGGEILDFPGDIIRLHQKLGWKYHARYAIWKEPLRVAIRTRSKGLMHRQIVKDSTFCNNAGADYVVVFKAPGENPAPVAHPTGLSKYVGEREIPEGLEAKFKDWQDHSTNKLAHWIWQQYASSFWDDIRINRVLPYKAARDKDDEKHVHPLQLDVIERLVLLWTNPDEVVLTPFMGVGSEVYGAVVNGRKGIGIELKPTYFRQAIKNLATAGQPETDQIAFEFAEGDQEWPDIAEKEDAAEL